MKAAGRISAAAIASIMSMITSMITSQLGGLLSSAAAVQPVPLSFFLLPGDHEFRASSSAQWGSFDGAYHFSYVADSRFSPQITIESREPDGTAATTTTDEEHTTNNNAVNNAVNAVNALGVFIAQECQGSAWNIPFTQQIGDGSCSFGRVARQLCPVQHCRHPRNRTDGNFTVALSSLALGQNSSFRLTAAMVPSMLSPNDPITVTTAPWRPRFLQLDFGDLESVDLHVTSDYHGKALLSLQNASCPVYDLPQNIRAGGLTQSISTQGLLVAKRPAAGTSLNVVVVLEATPGMCGSDQNATFQIHMKPSMAVGAYGRPVLYLLSLYGGIFLLFVVMILASRSRPLRNESPATSMELSTPNRNTIRRIGRRTWDDGTYSKEEKFFFRSKAVLHATDMSRKLPSLQKTKSMRYLWYLVIIALFYFLPVAQLVAFNVVQFHDGAQDSCYYNFQCARPLGLLPAFNNVVSNTGYIVLGLLYLIVVNHRHKRETKLGNKRDNSAFSRDLGLFSGFSSTEADLGSPDSARGLPQNAGIFYSLGFAMVCEGVFSACYHVCPSTINFQFDTSFMYLICIFQILALYQKRHLDSQSQPHFPYLAMATIVGLDVVGVYLQQWGYHLTFFYVVLFTAYSGLAYFASITIYLVATWKCGRSCFRVGDSKAKVSYLLRATDINPDEMHCESSSLIGSVQEEEGGIANTQLGHPQEYHLVRPVSDFLRGGLPTSAPYRRERVVLIMLVNCLNWAMGIYAIATDFTDVPYFFLLVLIANTLLYYTYYTTMKLLNRERLTWKPVLCLVFAMGSWGPAMHFFNIRLINLDDDAAVSRESNHPCVLMDFYDYHDIWHMLSSLGLFWTSCMLLTLDDDLINTPRKNIRCW